MANRRSDTDAPRRIGVDRVLPPIPLGLWVEGLAAMRACAEAGLDVEPTLRGLGFTRAGWAVANEWWRRHFAENATRGGGELYARYVQLRAELDARVRTIAPSSTRLTEVGRRSARPPPR